jgi:hypothetical protein
MRGNPLSAMKQKKQVSPKMDAPRAEQTEQAQTEETQSGDEGEMAIERDGLFTKQPQKGAVADPKFLSDIELGDVVDFFKNGRWVIGAVEAMTQYKTEIEVSTEEGG